MLPKQERLTKTDFVGIRPRIVLRGTFLDISVIPSTASRFACVITKKRVKRAVDRNRIKRKIYAIVREVKPKNPHLVILYPKINTLKGDYTHIQKEISEAFNTL